MEKSTWFGIGIFIVVVVVGLFFVMGGNGATGKAAANSQDTGGLSGQKAGNMKYISIDARWFEFNPNEIKVKQGEEIMLTINNLDVDHGIKIPELGLVGNSMITFTADKKGEFDFYCDNFCGEGHSEMVGKLIVE